MKTTAGCTIEYHPQWYKNDLGKLIVNARISGNIHVAVELGITSPSILVASFYGSPQPNRCPTMHSAYKFGFESSPQVDSYSLIQFNVLTDPVDKQFVLFRDNLADEYIFIQGMITEGHQPRPVFQKM